MEQPGKSRNVIDRTSLSCGRISPNIQELCAPHIATWQEETAHRGKRLRMEKHSKPCVRRCKEHIQDVFVRALRRSAKFLDVSNESFIAEDFAQRGLIHIEIQNASVAVHHWSDRWIQHELRAQLSGERPHTRVIVAFLTINTLAIITCMPCARNRRMASMESASEPGNFVMASCTSGRCE